MVKYLRHFSDGRLFRYFDTSLGKCSFCSKITRNITVKARHNAYNATGWRFWFHSSSVRPDRAFYAELSSTIDDIVMDDASFKELLKQVGAVRRARDGAYGVPCEKRSKLPALRLRFLDETVAEVRPMDYAQKRDAPGEDAGFCRLRFRGGATETWFLGQAFWDSVGVCLHYDTGLAHFFVVDMN